MPAHDDRRGLSRNERSGLDGTVKLRRLVAESAGRRKPTWRTTATPGGVSLAPDMALGVVHDAPTVAEVIERLKEEYRDASDNPFGERR